MLIAKVSLTEIKNMAKNLQSLLTFSYKFLAMWLADSLSSDV